MQGCDWLLTFIFNWKLPIDMTVFEIFINLQQKETFVLLNLKVVNVFFYLFAENQSKILLNTVLANLKKNNLKSCGNRLLTHLRKESPCSKITLLNTLNIPNGNTSLNSHIYYFILFGLNSISQNVQFAILMFHPTTTN